MKKNKNLLYAAVGITVVALVFVVLLAQKNQQGNPYQPAASECGDLTDPANIQHLSHHPQQYADCIKQVSPEKFQQATGQSLNEYLARYGIE